MYDDVLHFESITSTDIYRLPFILWRVIASGMKEGMCHYLPAMAVSACRCPLG